MLKRLIRNTSLSRLSALSKRSDMRIQEITEQQKIIDHWVGSILISGPSLRIAFNTRCTIHNANFFTALRYGTNTTLATNTHNHDFIHEYCNMVGGYINNALDQQQVIAGLNLPIVTRETNNLFIKIASETNIIYDHWKLIIDDISIICSVKIEIISALILNGEILEFIDSGDIKIF